VGLERSEFHRTSVVASQRSVIVRHSLRTMQSLSDWKLKTTWGGGNARGIGTSTAWSSLPFYSIIFKKGNSMYSRDIHSHLNMTFVVNPVN
jgi:hypothetical protein